ncbi:MAG: methylated-DNA--[protein]-cysteine S-methyltransferase [Acidimicrobiaceae bacterium]|nr:methylated-DNA--[protein]-cysteine S-methyltransferase [Acidimicrobiaceae bacterium]
MDLFRTTVGTVVGSWTVEGNVSGVTRIYMPHQRAPRTTDFIGDSVANAARQLREYFEGSRTSFDVTLSPMPATAFQRDVWRALQSLPYGSVATYSQVAQLVGRPRAARAVGNANHANPWPVIVPCHRVVAGHGLGGYGGGQDIKRYLLTLEGVKGIA